MKFKKSIMMLMVPAFVLAGCSQSDSVAVAENVAQTPEGAFVQVADTLNKSYEEAKSKGYTGTYEEWVKLLELHQTNPQQAAQQASANGFNGMDMLMAGAMGMMLGNMMSNNAGGHYNQYKEKQRSMGSSAYIRPAASTMNSYRSVESRSVAAKSASVSRSSSVSRGGFGGAVSSGG